MNIFLPYADSIEKSVQSLDSRRLNKQILECYVLLSNAIRFCNGELKEGYSHHPVSVFYQNNPDFIAYYGFMCCEEYTFRTNSLHKYYDYFAEYLKKKVDNEGYDIDTQPPYTPYYAAGRKGTSDEIRTTENVSELFQNKLIDKWETDKTKGRSPVWGCRNAPIFYTEFLEKQKTALNGSNLNENLKTECLPEKSAGV